jgi:hypothetical protein
MTLAFPIQQSEIGFPCLKQAILYSFCSHTNDKQRRFCCDSLGKQKTQFFEVAFAKIANGSKIRLLPGSKENKGDVLPDCLSNISRTDIP